MLESEVDSITDTSKFSSHTNEESNKRIQAKLKFYGNSDEDAVYKNLNNLHWKSKTLFRSKKQF